MFTFYLDRESITTILYLYSDTFLIIYAQHVCTLHRCDNICRRKECPNTVIGGVYPSRSALYIIISCAVPSTEGTANGSGKRGVGNIVYNIVRKVRRTKIIHRQYVRIIYIYSYLTGIDYGIYHGIYHVTLQENRLKQM